MSLICQSSEVSILSFQQKENALLNHLQQLSVDHMTPSDPTTIVCALVEARRLIKNGGQLYTILTADQQLYRVTLNVMWFQSDMIYD